MTSEDSKAYKILLLGDFSSRGSKDHEIWKTMEKQGLGIPVGLYRNPYMELIKVTFLV